MKLAKDKQTTGMLPICEDMISKVCTVLERDDGMNNKWSHNFILQSQYWLLSPHAINAFPAMVMNLIRAFSGFHFYGKVFSVNTIQLMHYSHFKTHSLQHLKPIKC
jgi:hypothetical protein